MAFLGYAIFGFSFLFSKRALDIATPFVLLAARFTVAFLILNALLLLGKFRLDLKGKQLKLLLLLGFFQPVLYFICENYGVKLLDTSFIGTIVALVPIISAIFGFILLKERVVFFQVFCAILSIFGVVITTWGQRMGSFSWLGFILILLAVCSTSIYNVLSKKISGQYTAFERTYVMMGLGSAVFIALAAVQSRNNLQEMLFIPLASVEFWTSVLYLAGMSSVVAFLLLNQAIAHLDVAKAAIFANITTVVTILAGVIILREHFGWPQAIGSVIIIASAYGVNKSGKPSK
ncbi:MAG: DMT family transporter, partial [Clostridia bacterium]|nr:DMT family transporter [Clostridia bacterium]